MKQRHAKACWCSKCAATKTIDFKRTFQERIRLMDVPRLPEHPDQLVPVRAHFRRQHNYLRKHPELRKLATEFVKTLIAKSTVSEQ